MKKFYKVISIIFDIVLAAVVIIVLLSGNGDFMDYFFAISGLAIEISLGIYYRRREDRRNKESQNHQLDQTNESA